MTIVRKINSRDLDVKIREKREKALVLFYGNWCQDCREFKPLWEDWTKGKTGPIFAVEIVRGGPEWEEWSIEEIPTVAAYSKGFEMGRADGVISENDLDSLWKDKLSLK